MKSLFAPLVKARRAQLRVSLTQLATACGTNKGYLSGIENGKVNPPSPPVIRRMAKKLDLKLERLLLLAWVDKAPKEIRRFLATEFGDYKPKN